MAVLDQKITDRYALYNGDCCEVLAGWPEASIDMAIYSPPFCGLYNYSSDDRDMSNNGTYDQFFEHYEFLVEQMARVTKPGRMNVIHCMDIPNPGQRDGYFDLPGAIIRLHEKHGFYFFGRVTIWKEPLRVAIRTRLKHLTHKQLVADSCGSTIAAGDCLVIMKKRGDNAVPVRHPTGLSKYAGERDVPGDLSRFEGEVEQKENRLSQWIWRHYASCVWDDIRIDRVLPFREAKEPDDEKHVHPLQLDVIDRAVVLWSNPGEAILTPFMGVGSEAYGAVAAGRRAIGIELKPSYYKQALRNIEAAGRDEGAGADLFADLGAAS
jgi:DNA modification methylase